MMDEYVEFSLEILDKKVMDLYARTRIHAHFVIVGHKSFERFCERQRETTGKDPDMVMFPGNAGSWGIRIIIDPVAEERVDLMVPLHWIGNSEVNLFAGNFLATIFGCFPISDNTQHAQDSMENTRQKTTEAMEGFKGVAEEHVSDVVMKILFSLKDEAGGMMESMPWVRYLQKISEEVDPKDRFGRTLRAGLMEGYRKFLKDLELAQSKTEKAAISFRMGVLLEAIREPQKAREHLNFCMDVNQQQNFQPAIEAVQVVLNRLDEQEEQSK